MGKQTFKLGEDWLTAGKAMQIVNNEYAVTLSRTTEQKIADSWK